VQGSHDRNERQPFIVHALIESSQRAGREANVGIEEQHAFGVDVLKPLMQRPELSAPSRWWGRSGQHVDFGQFEAAGDVACTIAALIVDQDDAGQLALSGQGPQGLGDALGFVTGRDERDNVGEVSASMRRRRRDEFFPRRPRPPWHEQHGKPEQCRVLATTTSSGRWRRRATRGPCPSAAAGQATRFLSQPLMGLISATSCGRLAGSSSYKNGTSGAIGPSMRGPRRKTLNALSGLRNVSLTAVAS